VVNLYAGSKKSLGGATKYIMTASIVGFRFRMPPGGGEVFFVIFFFLFVTALNGSVSAHSITTKSFEIRNSLGTVGNKVYSYASAFNFVSVTSWHNESENMVRVQWQHNELIKVKSTPYVQCCTAHLPLLCEGGLVCKLPKFQNAFKFAVSGYARTTTCTDQDEVLQERAHNVCSFARIFSV